MSYEWKNKVVLVTGGANGIGSSIVKCALDEGAKHVAVLDIASNGEKFAEELNRKYGDGKVKFYKCDVTDDKLLNNIIEDVKNNNEYLDVVVNNAGILNDGQFKKTIEVNFLAVVSSSLKSLKIMRQDEGGKGGTIINIASVAALIQIPIVPVYSATKSAILQFSNSLGMDAFYSRTNVRVITICFGVTDSNIIRRENYTSFDKAMEDSIEETFNAHTMQTLDFAGKSTIDIYKQAESGSTWLVANNEPPKDVSDNIRKGYETFMS